MKKALVWLGLFGLSVLVAYYLSGPYRTIAVPTLMMIGLHELGHLGMAKYFGQKTGGFYFIPGLGGVALIDLPADSWKVFWIAYAGPVAGLAQVLLLLFVNIWIEWPFLTMLAGIWALINLINLFPSLPLDGGKIVWSIAVRYNPVYLTSTLFHVLMFISLFVIASVAGLIFPLIILMMGLREQQYLVSKTATEGFAPMTQKQFWLANLLFFLLNLVLLGIWYWTNTQVTIRPQ